MITVIFSSKENRPEFIKHLKKTSGVKDIKIVNVINNSNVDSPFFNGGESLTSIYSRELDKAETNIVVMCHDDILFETKNWGKVLLDNFNNSEFGVIGLAGSTELTENGRWWSDPKKMVGIVNHKEGDKRWVSTYSADLKDDIVKTVVVDGLFIAVDKSRLKYEFDTSVEGFHFYDVDFSFGNHVNGCDVGVCFNIRVEHASKGATNNKWEINRGLFIRKWFKFLPTTTGVDVFYDDFDKKLNKSPKVSIIIPTKSNLDVLFKCLDSILEKSNYPNYDVYIADTGSSVDEIKQIKSKIKNINNFSLIEYDYYNFAKINNDVVSNHIGESELLLFCNNDIELLNDAISVMVYEYIKHKNNIGTLGARLHYPNNTIQHSGILTILNGPRSVVFTHIGLGSSYGYIPTKRVFGNTGAFLMIRKDLFEKVGMFNPDYIECFEDVELNIECLNRGKDNYFVSEAVCYHHESLTRGSSQESNNRIMTDYNERLLPLYLKSKKTHKFLVRV